MDVSKYPGSEDLTPDQILAVERNAAHEIAKRGTPSLAAYSIAVGVLVLGSPYGADHPEIIYPAIVLFVLTLGIRLGLLLKFEQLYDRNPKSWHRIRRVSLTMTSLVWGTVSGLAIYYYQTSWTPLIATAATAAICSGGILSLGMDKRISQAHVLVILVPNAIASLLVGGYGMAVFFITYLAFCLFQIRYVNEEYWHARITAVKLDSETKQRLHNLTYHDSLTDLPNRELFIDRLQQLMLDAGRREITASVLFIGLDRFKQVNDTLGHQAGDRLIKEVAQRISRNLRENDTLARYSGDTFAMAISDIKDARDVARVANKVIKEFYQPFELNGLELFVTASIGITLFPTDALSADALLKNAEATMYRVKKNGGNSYQYFEEHVNEESLERLQLETKLRRALEKDEYCLHYQPKVDLKSGKLSGFEALIRWCPKGADMVPPFKFIPVLEDTGLIVPVGEWVLREACKQAKTWQDEYNNNLCMAVNLSARQLTCNSLVDSVKRALQDAGLEAQYLELEITESMLIEDTDNIMQVLEELHSMGVHLSIDDFGTGYSSLSYLKRMPIDTLKIDRSFVRDVTTDVNDAAVVETIIAMAHTLDLKVVAEGSETIEQVKYLQQQNCDETQGFFFSKPLPSNEIRDMLDVGTQLLSEDNLISIEDKLAKTSQQCS